MRTTLRPGRSWLSGCPLPTGTAFIDDSPMPGLFDSSVVKIPCPKCGHEQPQSIGWLKSHNELICASCGNKVAIDNREFIRIFEEMEKALADLRGTIRDLGR